MAHWLRRGSKKRHDDRARQQEPDQRDATQEGARHRTEEDLQPRDAGEMPREPQNPVNPNPETPS